MGLILPGMSGADLAHRLRALPGGAELPVVAVSGFPGLGEEGRARIAEFDAVLVKPIDPPRLVEIVRTYAPTIRDGEPET